VSSLALHETLKWLIVEKGANANRDERRLMEKEATIVSFLDL
jgi:hypothetical protein